MEERESKTEKKEEEDQKIIHKIPKAKKPIRSANVNVPQLTEYRKVFSREAETITIRKGQVVRVLSMQILIKLSALHRGTFATLNITLPNSKIDCWEKIRTGTRRQYECMGETYLFDLLEIREEEVEIAITKRQ